MCTNVESHCLRFGRRILFLGNLWQLVATYGKLQPDLVTWTRPGYPIQFPELGLVVTYICRAAAVRRGSERPWYVAGTMLTLLLNMLGIDAPIIHNYINC
jgi:hypothetical protein